MKAVITAGGRITGEFAREAGTPIKALVRVRGVTMLDRIVDALRGAGAQRIAIVGGEEVRAA
ncbi:MAG: NTP transferase domain-containing protein, partial [Candidatus Eremiobacteraeota bacterium]|nr:NTP transferase domain-containing protein [Candidatus Eremiobacteraeota bacterium]